MGECGTQSHSGGPVAGWVAWLPDRVAESKDGQSAGRHGQAGSPCVTCALLRKATTSSIIVRDDHMPSAVQKTVSQKAQSSPHTSARQISIGGMWRGMCIWSEAGRPRGGAGAACWEGNGLASVVREITLGEGGASPCCCCCFSSAGPGGVRSVFLSPRIFDPRPSAGCHSVGHGCLTRWRVAPSRCGRRCSWCCCCLIRSER